MSVVNNTDPLFQSSLQDLAKGIRSHKRLSDASAFISSAIADLKRELRSSDPFIKAEAVRKATYLQMFGYDVSWAAFAIVEVMSLPRFAHKRAGYLAAAQTFDQHTDVVLLTTNLFKKEFTGSGASNASILANSASSLMSGFGGGFAASLGLGGSTSTYPSGSTGGIYEIGSAVNCLARIATKELARDCLGDVVQLMRHAHPYVRRKAILALYQLYVRYPPGLRLTFDALRERLTDSDPGVVSTAVHVICELAHRNPKNFLSLAPQFFSLLTSSANNWMLIKVVKLLGSLVSEEPRLARKLLDPLCSIIRSTSAKSLQYECIYTLTEALPYSRREDGSEAKNAASTIALCSEVLRRFLEEPDQNLNYLGLMGLCNLLKSSPRSVVEHRDLVLRCLSDEDVTVRSKALELISGIVSRRSLRELVSHLLTHVRRGESNSFRCELVSRILVMGRRDKYAMIDDFAWYLSVLLELVVYANPAQGEEIADQWMEVALRVEAVRNCAVDASLTLLWNENVRNGQAQQTVSEVLRAAVWIIGEYADVVSAIAQDVSADDDEESFWVEIADGEEVRSVWRGQPLFSRLIDTLLHPSSSQLTASVQEVYLQAVTKLVAFAASCCDTDECTDVVTLLRIHLPPFLQSSHVEVQERASTLHGLLVTLNILPSLAKAKELTQTPPLSSQNTDLIDMSSLIASANGSQRIPADSAGASAMMRQSDILATLVAEPFFTVHSKAQRRVPIPEGLDLTTPFHPQQLAALLSEGLNFDVSLMGLSLYPGDKSDTMPKNIPAPAAPVLPTTVSYSDNPSTVSSPVTTISTREREGDVYMLSSRKRSEDMMPLSNLLNEGIDEVQERRPRPVKQVRKKRTAEVDTRDVLPAGAYDIDENLPRSIGKRKGQRRTNADEDLGLVDITTPLREDEFIPAPRHREVPSVSHPSVQSADVSVFREVAEEVPSSAPSRKVKKEKKPPTEATDLDWMETAVSKSDRKQRRQKKSATIDDGLVKHPHRLLKLPQCRVSFGITRLGDTDLIFHWKTSASESIASPLSASLVIAGTLPGVVRQSVPSQVQLCTNLPAGDFELSNTTVCLLQSISAGELELTVTLNVTVGTDTQTLSLVLSLSPEMLVGSSAEKKKSKKKH